MKYTSHKIDFCRPCRAKKNTNNFLIGNFTILTQLCYFFVVFWPFLFALLWYNFFFTMKNCALLFVDFLCVVRSNVTSLNLSFKSVMAAEQAVRKEFRLTRVEMSTCNQCQLHENSLKRWVIMFENYLNVFLMTKMFHCAFFFSWSLLAVFQ